MNTITMPSVHRPKTRFAIRLFALALIAMAAFGVSLALETWRMNEAMWADWGGIWESDESSSGIGVFWFRDFGYIASGVMMFSSLLVTLVAIGLWRFRRGARLASIVLVAVTFLLPEQSYLIWGSHAAGINEWTVWLAGAVAGVVLLWFLCRKGTREVTDLDNEPRFPWPWKAIACGFILLSLTPAASVVALKTQLALKLDFPFWALSGPLEEVDFQSDHPAYRDWAQVELLGTSFAVPPSARLGRFPVDLDRDLPMVTISAEIRGERSLIILNTTSSFDYYPADLMTKVGVEDGVGLARLAYASNWSFQPLLMRGVFDGSLTHAFWLEDGERQMLVTVEDSAERTGIWVDGYRRKTGGAREAAEITYIVPDALGDPETVIGLLSKWNRATRIDEDPGDRVAPAGIQHELALLTSYWNGDLESGVALAESLLEHEPPVVSIIDRLLKDLLHREPDNADAIAAQQRLAEQKSDASDE